MIPGNSKPTATASKTSAGLPREVFRIGLDVLGDEGLPAVDVETVRNDGGDALVEGHRLHADRVHLEVVEFGQLFRPQEHVRRQALFPERSEAIIFNRSGLRLRDSCLYIIVKSVFLGNRAAAAEYFQMQKFSQVILLFFRVFFCAIKTSTFRL